MQSVLKAERRFQTVLARTVDEFQEGCAKADSEAKVIQEYKDLYAELHGSDAKIYIGGRPLDSRTRLGTKAWADGIALLRKRIAERNAARARQLVGVS